MPKNKYFSGFTLIELLIVIVIIGILAAAVIVVIDPASQQRKAKEAVVRANVDKGCLALNECYNFSLDDARKCDTKAEVGIRDINDNPPGARYVLTNSYLSTNDYPPSNTVTRSVYYKGIIDTCEVLCLFHFNQLSFSDPSYISTFETSFGYIWANPLYIKNTCLIR